MNNAASLHETVVAIRQLSNLALDMIKDELVRCDHSHVTTHEAYLLYCLGSQELTPTDIRNRQYYLGSNASYTLKKLEDEGFLDKKQCTGDKRKCHVRATEKGRAIARIVNNLFDRQTDELHAHQNTLRNLLEGTETLQGYWKSKIRLIY